MGLSRAIAKAEPRDLADLSRYVAGELEMACLNVGEQEQAHIDPKEVAAAISAWAYMQQNQADGDD